MRSLYTLVSITKSVQLFYKFVDTLLLLSLPSSSTKITNCVFLVSSIECFFFQKPFFVIFVKYCICQVRLVIFFQHFFICAKTFHRNGINNKKDYANFITKVENKDVYFHL